jgi:hypothetical protein
MKKPTRLDPRTFPAPGTIDHRPMKSGAFGHLPAKKPCIECPLSRTAKPGYLGGYTPSQYIDVLHGIGDIACHLSPGFIARDPAEQRSCTGVAMFRANIGGIALADNAQAAVDHVGADAEAVFATDAAFIAHHATWRDYAVMATRGNATLLGTILLCVLDRNGDGCPRFVGKASVTSDGFILCDYVSRGGVFNPGAFAGAMADLDRNIAGLADHLKLSADDRIALRQAVRDWIALDYRG